MAGTINICFVNINPAAVSQPFIDLLSNEIFPKVVGPDSKVTIKCVEPGLKRAGDPVYMYFGFINAQRILESVVEASRQGFDAIVVGCSEDTAVREAREVVDIPVIAVGEASFHVACMLGNKFGIVTLNEPKIIPRVENTIRAYGLQDRLIPNPIAVLSMPTFDVFTKGFGTPEAVVDDILDKATICVARGAEVVVVQSTGLGTFLSRFGISKLEGTGTPILCQLSVGLKMAEFRVELNRVLGMPSVSRARMYAKPSEQDIARVRKLFGLPALG